MSLHFAVPDSVQASQRARDAARNTTRPCAGDAGRCRRQARHRCASVAGSYCGPCWEQLGLAQPTPDPALSLDGLRAAAGLRLDITPGFDTVADQRARDSGRRASGATREASR